MSCCCSPLAIPVIGGEVGHGYRHLFFVFSFFSSLFSHYILYHQFPTPSTFCCCSPLSSHSFQISLNAVFPSHSRSSSLPFSGHLFQFFPHVRPISTYLYLELYQFSRVITVLHKQMLPTTGLQKNINS